MRSAPWPSKRRSSGRRSGTIVSPRTGWIRGGVVLLCAMWFTAAAAQTQGEMNASAATSYRAANAELAQAVALYRSRLRAQQLELFNKSQRQWERFRAAACDFESSGVTGGSLRPMLQTACLEEITRERLLYIQKLSRCEEGDLSCPARRPQP
jgi:uncharacterized protein YecT (DUF1311 family)